MPSPGALSLAVLLLLAGADAASTPKLWLNNGVELPVLGAGAEKGWDAAACREGASAALQAGVRFLLSSVSSGEECQRAQQEALHASGVARPELFVAATVNTQSCAWKEDCYSTTKAAAEKQLTLFGAGQLDMLLLELPAESGCEGIRGQWHALMDIYRDASGPVRSIGVMNFGIFELRCFSCPENVPQINLMPFNTQYGKDILIDLVADRSVDLVAETPLGDACSLANDLLLKQIGQAHGKTAAQVALKWILQKGNVGGIPRTAALLRTKDREILKQSVGIFDFELTDSEMAQISDRGTKMSPHATTASLMSASSTTACPNC